MISINFGKWPKYSMRRLSESEASCLIRLEAKETQNVEGRVMHGKIRPSNK